MAALKEMKGDPLKVRQMEEKIGALRKEIQGMEKQLKEEEAKRKASILRTKKTVRTIRKVKELIGIPGDVWAKAKMFDAQLEKDGHISGTKMVGFLMSQGAKMDITLGAMRATLTDFNNRLTELPGFSSEEDSSSGSAGMEPLEPADVEEQGTPAVKEEVSRPTEEMGKISELPATPVMESKPDLITKAAVGVCSHKSQGITNGSRTFVDGNQIDRSIRCKRTETKRKQEMKK